MKRIFLFLAFLMLTATPGVTLNATTVVPAPGVVSSEPDPKAVKAALEEFNSLSRKEKKERLKEARKELKSFKKEKRQGNAPSEQTLLLVILAILLPPLAVYLHQGEINTKFWISLLLTFLFWLPGVIYALIVVLGADK